MSTLRILIDGRTYLTLEDISDCYQCEVSFLRDAYEVGLLGGGRRFGGRLVLEVTILDRVADVVRLSRYQGLSLETIVVLLGDRAPDLAHDESA